MTTLVNSYTTAMSTLKARKGDAGTLTWDAGEGWKGEAFWCPRRRRIVQFSVNPHGDRIVV